MIAERLNQTIQRKLIKCIHEDKTNRNIDALPKLVKNYNNSYNGSIKIIPIEASK